MAKPHTHPPSNPSLTLTLLLTLSVTAPLPTTPTAQLFLQTAGPHSKTLQPLPTDRITPLCPARFPKAGITIRCIPPPRPAVTAVAFYVNGRLVGSRGRRPFVLAGNTAEGWPKAWVVPAVGAVVACVSRAGTYRTTLQFVCDGGGGSGGTTAPKTTTTTTTTTTTVAPKRPQSPMRVPKGKAGTLYFRTIGDNPLYYPVLSFTPFCPTTIFSTAAFTLYCHARRPAAPPAAAATFRVDGRVARRDATVPYHVTDEWRNGNPKRWLRFPTRAFNVSCRLSGAPSASSSRTQVRIACPRTTGGTRSPPTTTTATTTVVSKATPTARPTTDSEKRRAGCIILAANKPSTPVTPGWQRIGPTSLAFRRHDASRNITGWNKAQLFYDFQVRKRSRYAIVLDMTTSGSSEHNDVWLRLTPGDFQVMRRGVSRGVRGWIKGYHNKNGRAAMISHVNDEAHSIASGDILKPGTRYRFGLAGRSTMVVVHRIVLFPCGEGGGCQRAGWGKTQNICLPGTSSHGR